MKTKAVRCQHTCDLQRYLEILWRLIFVNDFINTFIRLWHGGMTYAETVPSWFPLRGGGGGGAWIRFRLS